MGSGQRAIGFKIKAQDEGWAGSRSASRTVSSGVRAQSGGRTSRSTSAQRQFVRRLKRIKEEQHVRRCAGRRLAGVARTLAVHLWAGRLGPPHTGKGIGAPVRALAGRFLGPLRGGAVLLEQCAAELACDRRPLPRRGTTEERDDRRLEAPAVTMRRSTGARGDRVNEPARLRLSVLGGFRLELPGEVAALPSGSRRLLGFLALHDRAVSRIAIAGTLWPDVPETQAYASLRSAVCRLKGTVRGTIEVSLHDLELGDDVDVDLRSSQALAHRLLGDDETALKAADLTTAAVGCLSADLLPGWYDDWAVLEAEDWRQLRMHALEALAGHLTTGERYGDAISAALAVVRAEPLRESARAALMRAHLAEGNQSEAFGEFRRYRSLLSAELGLEPTRKLSQLLQR